MGLGPARRRWGGWGRGAFTLAELVVVLAIVALAALLIAPRMAAMARGDESRRVRDGVVEVVRGGRALAMERGAPVSITFDPRARVIGADERLRFPLPKGWRVEGGATAPGAASGFGRDEEKEVQALTLLVWSPDGLASRSSWKVTNGERAIEVAGDAIDGVRVRQ